MKNQVTLLYFAGIAELLGRREEVVSLPSPSTTISDLARSLEERYPELSGRLDTVRFAVNETFAASDDAISPGDTVAVIPPVSGG